MTLKEFIDRTDLRQLDPLIGVCTPDQPIAADLPVQTIERTEHAPKGWTVQLYVADILEYLTAFDTLPRAQRADAIIDYLMSLEDER